LTQERKRKRKRERGKLTKIQTRPIRYWKNWKI